MALKSTVQDEDWQQNILGIGIVEFIELSSQEEFIDRINEFLPEDGQMFEFCPQETHPRFPVILDSLYHEIELPDKYGKIFDQVYVHPYIDTNNIVRILLYGSIDPEIFLNMRKEDYQESNQQLHLENSGLHVLREAEAELSKFFFDEIGTGLFSTEVAHWSTEQSKRHEYPGFWFYDFSDTEINSQPELLEKRQEETMFLGMGINDEPDQNLTKYANERCIANGDGRRYFQTELGSFPFRYILVRLLPEETHGSSLWSRPYDQNQNIPKDFSTGIAPLTRSYVHLVWSLKTYYDLETYVPEDVLGANEKLQTQLRGMTDAKKAVTLDELYESNRELESYWTVQQRQFQSIKTTKREFGGFANDEHSVAKPIVSAASEIESLCEEKVDRYERRYQRLIDRVQANLDANIGLVSKRLSIVLLAITLINMLLAIPRILTRPYPVFSLLVLGGILFGTVWMLAQNS